MPVNSDIKNKGLTKDVNYDNNCHKNCAKIEHIKRETINALKQIAGGKRKLEAILKQ